MDLEIKERTALVLGAGGGLGSAIAEALAAEGASVAMIDISEESLAATGNVIQKAAGRAKAFPCDLREIDSFQTVVGKIQEWAGSIDILVNISGGPPPAPAGGQSPEVWREQFEKMVVSLIALTDLVLPDMRRRRWGRVITCTSSGVIAPIPNLGFSNALRLSLVGWSKTLAREVARDRITANIVVPGRIATARTHELDGAKAAREGKSIDTVMAESTHMIPIGRYGKPEEFASAVAFLASQRAAYITGSVLRIDGGLIASI
ncbi:MAG: SDR family oxidoreductase [Rhizobiaceae bacterium]|nr:SDR family oxidoreductase [Rhizobiaceae bacterium]